jgi:hypothetical protein
MFPPADSFNLAQNAAWRLTLVLPVKANCILSRFARISRIIFFGDLVGGAAINSAFRLALSLFDRSTNQGDSLSIAGC